MPFLFHYHTASDQSEEFERVLEILIPSRLILDVTKSFFHMVHELEG